MTSLDLVFDAETIPELEKDTEWWNIYETSIPESEREPRGVIFSGMEKGTGKALRARLAGQTVGMANINVFHHPATVFLSLLAIASDHRDHHIGGSLFDYSFRSGNDALKEKGIDAAGMVWEVDDPSQAGDAKEKEVRNRRIAFYEHRGGVVLPCAYILPPLAKGRSPQKMKLMFKSESDFMPDISHTKKIIWSIYFEKYHAINGIDEKILNELLKMMDL